MPGKRTRWSVLAVAGLLALAGLVAALSRTSTEVIPPCLAWRPPALEDPEVIEITADNQKLELDDERDYLLKLPAVPLTSYGGVSVTGGRNVVLIGGEIRVPPVELAEEPYLRRGMMLSDQTGVLHVEGVRIAGDDLAEGISLAQPQGAIVQLQAMDVGPVYGSFEANHADVVQTWAGPRALRIDLLRGTTSYQGFFLLPNQYRRTTVDEFDLRRVQLTALQEARYLLWTERQAPWLTLKDVWIETPDGTATGRLRPQSGVWTDVNVAKVGKSGLVWPKSIEPGVEYASPGYCLIP